MKTPPHAPFLDAPSLPPCCHSPSTGFASHLQGSSWAHGLQPDSARLINISMGSMGSSSVIVSAVCPERQDPVLTIRKASIELLSPEHCTNHFSQISFGDLLTQLTGEEAEAQVNNLSKIMCHISAGKRCLTKWSLQGIIPCWSSG